MRGINCTALWIKVLYKCSPFTIYHNAVQTYLQAAAQVLLNRPIKNAFSSPARVEERHSSMDGPELLRFPLSHLHCRVHFGVRPPIAWTHQRLCSLWQGTCGVADYAVEFCTLAAGGRWNEAALRDAFYNGLADAFKDELVVLEETGSLRKFINLAIALDTASGRIRGRRGPTPVAGFLVVCPTYLGALLPLLLPHQRSRCSWRGHGSLPPSGSATFGTGRDMSVLWTAGPHD